MRDGNAAGASSGLAHGFYSGGCSRAPGLLRRTAAAGLLSNTLAEDMVDVHAFTPKAVSSAVLAVIWVRRWPGCTSRTVGASWHRAPYTLRRVAHGRSPMANRCKSSPTTPVIRIRCTRCMRDWRRAWVSTKALLVRPTRWTPSGQTGSALPRRPEASQPLVCPSGACSASGGK